MKKKKKVDAAILKGGINRKAFLLWIENVAKHTAGSFKSNEVVSFQIEIFSFN